MARADDKAPKSATPTTRKKPVAKKGATGASARPRKPKAAKTVEKRPPGRPSAYTEALGLAICEGIACGMSLRKLCAAEDMPAIATVLRWLGREDYAEFREQYARAREAQADYLAEELLEIADDGRNDTYEDDEGRTHVDYDHIARSRLRVDARKWLASKMAPKRYGDKITNEHTGANGGAIEVKSTVTFVQPKPRGDDE